MSKKKREKKRKNKRLGNPKDENESSKICTDDADGTRTSAHSKPVTTSAGKESNTSTKTGDSLTTEQIVKPKKKPKKNKKRKRTPDAVDQNQNKVAVENTYSSPKRTKQTIESIQGTKEPATSNVTVTFPFPTDPDDHCESPLAAYQHIQPLLERVCGKDASESCIYDPYFCNGAVVENLGNMGFTNVYNKKEDCYHTWSARSEPSFTVLVTNPPYSGNHIERLMYYVTSPRFGNRPWFLLLPQWVHKRDYYQEATRAIRPFYLVPKKRYVYVPPKDFRAAKKSDVHKKSSPFVSMWYCWGGTTGKTEELIRLFYKRAGRNAETPCELARSKSALRDLRRKK